MLDMLNEVLANRLLVVAVVGMGLILTVRSRAMQIRHFLGMFAVLRRSFHHDAGRFSAYQALTMSLAGRVGSGNIAGVAFAVAVGGPGAVFWMWVVGILGMVTSYFECSLAQLFKVTNSDGSYRGGPAFYIERGLGRRWLALLFSGLLVLHAGFLMNAFQSFTTASSLQDAFGISTSQSGVIMVVVLGFIVFGGIRRIVTAADVLVPFMVLGYLAAAIFVIATHIEDVPRVITMIVTHAFGIEQVLGGGVGAAIVNGAKRGLFSNEAGLGTAPNVAAIAQTRHPAAQGMLQALSVFIDTMIVCTATAVIVLFSEAYTQSTAANGVLLTQTALTEHLGPWGGPFISIAIVLFAFTSVMYSYYLAENCLMHMGLGGRAPIAAFRVLSLAVVYWGTQQDLSTIFRMADLMMACLAGVNLYALASLSGLGLRLLRDYEQQLREGRTEPELDPAAYADVNLDHDAWRGR